ncbi:MAG: YqaE/Pmp3 family membrane protein [Verrucomicrobiota bacterium JB023]|nr:YqaE/Pmp3 family membrane protein [Verrucomicrobiota bacterium JB023]
MNHSTTTHEGSKDLLRIIVAILLPPVGVLMQVGFGAQFWLNVVLTLLGYIPGIIHALYIILTRK